LLWVLIAGLIGFVGNDVVGSTDPGRVPDRIRGAGRRRRPSPQRRFHLIGGRVGVIGNWLGFPLADPLVRRITCIAILVSVVRHR